MTLVAHIESAMDDHGGDIFYAHLTVVGEGTQPSSSELWSTADGSTYHARLYGPDGSVTNDIGWAVDGAQVHEIDVDD